MDTPAGHVSVSACARCGGAHENVALFRFRRAVTLGVTGCRWSYWGTCPVTGEPWLAELTNDEISLLADSSCKDPRLVAAERSNADTVPPAD